jgi:hypothetical protein
MIITLPCIVMVESSCIAMIIAFTMHRHGGKLMYRHDNYVYHASSWWKAHVLPW